MKGETLALVGSVAISRTLNCVDPSQISRVCVHHLAERIGFLVPLGQPQALAERIIYLLTNPNLSKEMGRKGRKRVKAFFFLDSMIVKLEKLYRELLNQEAV